TVLPPSASSVGITGISPAVPAGPHRRTSPSSGMSTSEELSTTVVTSTPSTGSSVIRSMPCEATPRTPSREEYGPDLRSGGAAADQPDGRRNEQHRQGEQPAALDPLEGPEPAAGLIAAPLRVAVPGEALRGRDIRVSRAEARDRADELGAPGGERERAVLGVP